MRLPDVDAHAGGGVCLGVGLDLSWGAPIGFVHDPTRGDVVADRVVRFLEAHAPRFSHLFVSFQVRNGRVLLSILRSREYRRSGHA